MRTHTFELEDKSYTLKFDYNSICDIEEYAGEPIQNFVSENKIGLNQVRIIMWAGLKWKLAGITKQQVGFMLAKLMENGQYQDVVKKMFELLPQAFPNFKSEEEESVGE